jgi:hypothetical protein
MESITIIQLNPFPEATFEVSIDGETTTQHIIRLDEDYYHKLTKGKISAEELIRRSIAFLLEREPNTSILASFDLPLIGNYFPEYEKKVSVN